MSKQIFQISPNLSPINFVSIKNPLYIYENIKTSNISIKEAEKNQKQFKSRISEITTGNPNNRTEDQTNGIKNIKSLMTQEKTLSNYLLIIVKSTLKLYTKLNMEQDLKY